MKTLNLTLEDIMQTGEKTDMTETEIKIALAKGHLWHIDSGCAGEDCLLIGATETEALLDIDCTDEKDNLPEGWEMTEVDCDEEFFICECGALATLTDWRRVMTCEECATTIVRDLCGDGLFETLEIVWTVGDSGGHTPRDNAMSRGEAIEHGFAIDMRGDREPWGWDSEQEVFWPIEMNPTCTSVDVADMLSLTQGRVRQLCRESGIGKKAGRDWLFTRGQVKELMQWRKGE